MQFLLDPSFHLKIHPSLLQTGWDSYKDLAKASRGRGAKDGAGGGGEVRGGAGARATADERGGRGEDAGERWFGAREEICERCETDDRGWGAERSAQG